MTHAGNTSNSHEPKDWRLIFKASSGSDKPVYDFWMGSECNDTLDDCNKNITQKCEDNYKSEDVNYFEDMEEVL